MHTRISLGIKFQLKLKILIFWTKSAQVYFRQKSEKNEHLHLTLHIPICLGTKFQLKLAILIFGLNLPKKGISDQKQKK